MRQCQRAPNAVSPEKIPLRRLSNGTLMPAIGLGTFGSDNADADLVAGVVRDALRMGYRYIDCAACYGNEPEIGRVLREAMDDGLPREEMFILSKLWNDKLVHAAPVAPCRKSITDLPVGYLDVYLVHWPFPN